MTNEKDSNIEMNENEVSETVAGVIENQPETVENEMESAESKEETVTENNKEQNTVQEEFISEFAPEPIMIPKYNKEKEMRKAEKASEKKKKRKSKKNKKYLKILRRVVLIARSILLFVLLVAVASATLASILVKMNISEYSIETAIRNNEPESFIIGKIKYPEKIGFKVSSSKASMADILRDNKDSLVTVTYSDIERAISKSTYPTYIAQVAHNIIQHYIFGEPLKAVTSADISDKILENVSYIKLVTGVELGESACNEIGRYVAKSDAVKALSAENIGRQSAAEYTHITSVAFSTMVLICLVIAFALLVILTIIGCKGFAHKIIGWASIVSGAVIAVAGMLFKPGFVTSNEFIKCVIEALTKSFSRSAIVYALIALLVGVLVMLIGKAMNEDDSDDEYEEDYIDEIEQVSTAQ